MPGVSDVVALPAFRDNYIWAWIDGDRAVVVDPGDAAPVRQWLASNRLRLSDILITHWHPDHVGGVAELVASSGAMVYGPLEERPRLPRLDVALADGDWIHVGGMRFQVLAVPGHTLGHIAFHAPETAMLFCGDTLFHCGCGRLFEGTPEQMHASLGRLAALPDESQVYCTHEYTLANLAFARGIEPDHEELRRAEASARRMREIDMPTLPTTIARQKAINPFLRSHERPLWERVAAASGAPVRSPLDCFRQLRALKDKA